jgi:diguanylate cyclase (GGDEF)-like protein
MLNAAKFTGVLAVFVLAVAGVVWTTTGGERDAARETMRSLEAADDMLAASLSRESALRGYAQTRRRGFLEPYDEASVALADATDEARLHAGGDAGQLRAIREQERLADRWAASANDAIIQLRNGGDVAFETAMQRSELMTRFRRHNETLRVLIEQEAEARSRDVLERAVLLVLLLGAVFAATAGLLFRQLRRHEARRQAAERREHERQQEFSETLQVTESEVEAHALVKRHLERSVTGAEVLVLNRNNSRNRLEPTTPLTPGSRLAERLLDSTPSSCLAVRLGRTHAEAPEREPLLSCAVCGGGRSTCTPSLVGGEVIGSVLVEHPHPLGEREASAIGQTVSQAAPVLANLRNLAVAEVRAATDALTGLANTRALRDHLKRMLAHADRTGTPLAVVMCDLDHFKQINDVYGHEKGDHALAAAAVALASTVRESDVAGRYGGEEFLLLLPGTDREGALIVAEKLRDQVSRIVVTGVDRPITASFGLAVFPADAPDADLLLRVADRALYAAKAAGRNRVVAAADLAETDVEESYEAVAGAAGSSSDVRSISRVS